MYFSCTVLAWPHTGKYTTEVRECIKVHLHSFGLALVYDTFSSGLLFTANLWNRFCFTVKATSNSKNDSYIDVLLKELCMKNNITICRRSICINLFFTKIKNNLRCSTEEVRRKCKQRKKNLKTSGNSATPAGP